MNFARTRPGGLSRFTNPEIVDALHVPLNK